jgi:hypothetical protein
MKTANYTTIDTGIGTVTFITANGHSDIWSGSGKAAERLYQMILDMGYVKQVDGCWSDYVIANKDRFVIN